ncbi:hypothetical protein ACFVS2_20400 [Brevibacillus sp. NPDC058079]|uniref:hypothetical protein n=1 Tax=Brevibacillus sp. NPDC058079 TaxID=3346330 RepID=UPI0036E18B8D
MSHHDIQNTEKFYLEREPERENSKKLEYKVVFCYANGDSQMVTFKCNDKMELFLLMGRHVEPKSEDVKSITIL